MVVAAAEDGSLCPTALADDAHRAGLAVHAWTFRAENAFLPAGLREGSAPADHGRMDAEIHAHLAAGVDGFFSDFPDLARAVLDGEAR
jgi:glycerophosphoryl diester phosphodiesterase